VPQKHSPTIPPSRVVEEEKALLRSVSVVSSSSSGDEAPSPTNHNEDGKEETAEEFDDGAEGGGCDNHDERVMSEAPAAAASKPTATTKTQHPLKTHPLLTNKKQRKLAKKEQNKKIKEVTVENLSFGGGKWESSTKVLEDCVENPATALPKYLGDACDFMTKRGMSSDFPLIEQYTKVKEAIENGDVAYGVQWLKETIIAQIPTFHSGLQGFLAKDPEKFVNDPVMEVYEELKTASTFVPKEGGYSSIQEELKDALDQLIKSRAPFLPKLHKTLPVIGKILLGRTCVHFPLAAVLEKQDYMIYLVAYYRFWLMTHSSDVTLFLFYIMTGFGKNSEFSAGNKAAKKFADKIWANPVEVEDPSKGPLCHLVANENDARKKMLELVLHGEQKLLSKSHDIVLGLLAEKLGLPSRFTREQQQKKEEFEAYLVATGINKFSFEDDFKGDLLHPRPLSDGLKFVITRIDKHTAIETIKRIHSALPVIEM